MKTAELKTYLQVLKSKVKTSPYKEVEISGTQIKVRGEKGNADILFVLNCGTKGNGIYSPEALDMLLLDIEADIEAYRKRDVEGWQIAEYTTDNDLYVDKEVMARLAEASKYASKDPFRPSLCRVHFKNGDIMSTDGYRAYLDKAVNESLNGNLSPSTIAIIKKCFKYGHWHIAFGKTPWSDNTLQAFNGYLTIWDKGTETSQTPDTRTLLEGRDLDTNTVVEFPYLALKALKPNKNATKVELSVDKLNPDLAEITLDGKVLPLRANLKRVEAKTRKNSTLRVLMPRADRTEQGLTAFDLALMNSFPTTKSGAVMLRFKAGVDDTTGNFHEPNIILVV